MSAGKGDKPRNCFSKKYKSNYDTIIWNRTFKCLRCKHNIKNNFKICPSCGYEFIVKGER